MGRHGGRSDRQRSGDSLGNSGITSGAARAGGSRQVGVAVLDDATDGPATQPLTFDAALSPYSSSASYSSSVVDTAENLFAPVPRTGALPLSATAMPMHSQVIITPGLRWWESENFEDLQRAVEEVFADPSPSTDTYWTTDLSYVLDMPWSPAPTGQEPLLDDGPDGPRYLTDPYTGELYLADLPRTDPTPTGELVRPYVGEQAGSVVWAEALVVPPPTPVDGVGRAATRRSVVADGCRMPSRRELRERERATNSARAVALRRLAKGGMLVVTAFGVVAVAAPQVVPGADTVTGALSLGAVAGAQLTEGQAAGGSSAGPVVLVGDAPDKAQVNTTVAGLLAARLVKESAQAQLVGQAGQGAGAAAIAVAQAEAQAEKTRADAINRAVRDAQRDPRALARLMVADRGWSTAQYTCLDSLYMRESGWRWDARNSSSGAFGLGQALPASKMASYGSDYLTNPATQLKWGLDYIAERYGTPCAAWNHSQNTSPHWY